MVYRWVGAECGLRKTEKIFLANNEQRTIKRLIYVVYHYSRAKRASAVDKSGFQKIFEKKLT